MNRRRSFVHSLALGAAVLAAWVGLTPAARAAIEFDCDPPTCSFTGSDTLDVYVTVDGTITDLQGFSLNLEIESDFLTPVSVTRGTLLGPCPWAFFTSTSGDTILIDGAGLGCTVAGPGQIAHIQLIGVAKGLSPLRCRRSTLRDPANHSLAHDCPQHVIAYDTSTPVLPVTWARIKGMYRP